MNIRLILESSPKQQAETERVFHGGTMVIGRGDDADWQLDDPEMYVSRRHCILSDETGELMATDASSGGLFIDNAANPVGTGNAAKIEDGIRLRMGDFVIKVEFAAQDDKNPRPEDNAKLGGIEIDFGPAPEQEERRERPDSLPDPFDPRAKSRGRDPFGLGDDTEERPLKPAEWENPLGLDLRKERPEPDPPRDPFGDDKASDPGGAPERGGATGASKYFGGGAADPTPPPAPPPQQDPIDDDMPVVAEARPLPPEPPADADVAPPTQRTSAPPVEAPVRAGSAGDDSALRAALLRGMGLDPEGLSEGADTEAEMEELGARFRELVDGLMMLLRTRAQEKSRARVAQTIIANEDVNPLKFLATTEDALLALIQPRGKGYLPPDQAVTWAYRDLADHQIRTWRALQSALRRMIDRFDPQAIETEVQDLGLLEKLIAGGKSAKMWDIYEEHYHDIAKSAEEQFLGEVGVDFRDAYENKRSE